MTDVDTLWAAAYAELIGKASHELKGTLNGMALNLEVVRSRIEAGKSDAKSLGVFADAAFQEFETLSARLEAHLFLARAHRGDGPPDVALTLKHMATMLVPAAKADGIDLQVGGYDVAAPTAAPAPAVRLALATGLLALIKEGGSGACQLKGGVEPVVRFSHQSATGCSLGPGITKAIARDGIQAQESGGELTLAFPKYQ